MKTVRSSALFLGLFASIAACSAADGAHDGAPSEFAPTASDARVALPRALPAGNVDAAWRREMVKVAIPHDGCYRASRQKATWEEVPCGTPPQIPLIPASPGAGGGTPNTVGGGSSNDSTATTSGTIAWAEGSFPSVTGVTSETDSLTSAANGYTLQVNSNTFTSAACNGRQSSCVGWQQFVYQDGYVFMQYWMINYGSGCPQGWSSYQNNSCFKNSVAVSPGAQQPITNLQQLVLSAAAGSTDMVTFSDGDGTLYAASQASVLGLSGGWSSAEFNLFGHGNGSEANLNSGSTIVVQTLTDGVRPTTAAPTCSAASFTGETNNTSLVGSCCALGGVASGIQFTESNAAGAQAAACPGEAHDLIALTGGAAAAGRRSLDGYWGPGNSQHVNYLDASGHVHELYIAPGKAWADYDLTVASRGTPAAAGSPLHGYVGLDESQHVNYLDASGSIHELYIAPGKAWADYDLMLASGGTPASSTTTLDGYWMSDSSEHVNYVDVNGHVRELYVRPNTNWTDYDLTAATNGPPAVAFAGINGYAMPDGGQHVNYIDAKSHVRELYIHSGAGWVDSDLTSFTAGTLAASGSALDGYVGADGTQHVNYVDVSGHVRELFIRPGGSWIDADLFTLAGGGMPSAAASALSAFWGRDNSQHVHYLDVNGNVHELYINPDESWAQVQWTTGFPVLRGSALVSSTGPDGSRHAVWLDRVGHVDEAYVP